MLLNILVAVETVALFVAVPVLFLYFQERIKNLAREATDRALQDYRHEHEKELAALAASNQKQLTGFSLFTQKRHAVYGTLYRRVRMASDLYASIMWLSESPDFDRYTVEDAVELCERHKVPTSAMKRAVDSFSPDSKVRPGDALRELYSRVQRRDAGKAFVRAKSVEALYEVYLSDEVRASMQQVRSRIARVSVLCDHDGRAEREDEDARGEMLAAVQHLLQVMRAEIQHEAGTRIARAV